MGIQSMIRLQDVGKQYVLDKDLAYTALKGVDLTIKEAEFTAIMGPSGSGKSTLMHIIGLLDKPTKGKVIVKGRDIFRLDDNEISALRSEFVGFVFQQFNLINKMTIYENIILPAIYFRKKLKYGVGDKAEYLMKRVGIYDKKNSYPNRISGGEQQRAAIARALIMEPDLILADEPTGNVDSKTSGEIMKLLKDLNKRDKMTVVIVTHERDIAREARRIITLRDGQVVKK